MTFNGQFHKSYLEISEDVRPSNAVTLLIYAAAYDSQFSLFLREMHFPDLDAMFDDAMELESNMVASDMLLSAPPNLSRKV
jgi:hypothetical protein